MSDGGCRRKRPARPLRFMRPEPMQASEKSYWAPQREALVAPCPPHDTTLFYDRVLHVVCLACGADRALVIDMDPISPGAPTGSAHVYPVPASAEEARLWQYAAGYVSESARQGAPPGIPRDLCDELGIASTLTTPVFHGDQIIASIAVFAGSCSPPLDPHAKYMLDRLAGELTGIFRRSTPNGPWSRGLPRPDTILRARGVVESVHDLHGTLAVATSLPVKMSLAEAAAIRIMNEYTGELELVALAGGEQATIARPAIPTTRCRAVEAPAGNLNSGDSGLPSCVLLKSHPGARVLCIPLVCGPGPAGVLELWKPSVSRRDAAGERLVKAIRSMAERAVSEARIHSVGAKARTRTSFIDRASVVTRTSNDSSHVAQELLMGLRQMVPFDVGGFVDGCNNLQGAEGSSEIPATFPGGDADAKAWVSQAPREARPLGSRLRVSPFYQPGTRWPAGLLVPLVSGDRVVGEFVLGKRAGERFSLDEIWHLDEVRRELAVLWECFTCRAGAGTSSAERAMAERIAALEQLAAGTAHEIKNPLAVIKGYLQIIQADLAIPEETRKRIGRLFHQLDQINNVVEDFSQLARPVALEFTLLSLTRMLEEVLEIVEPQASSPGVKIVRSYSEDTPEVMADGGKLQQVFLNLCRNSMEAMMLTGGELRISTRTSTDGRTVEVEFRDTGPGMSSEVMSQIFRPFYTTKKHGTGLGLSISMHIVRQHGGTIRVESSPGAGAAFTVVLPVPAGPRT